MAKDFQHAMFSPSDKVWIRYDRDKIIGRIRQCVSVRRGTELHELAKKAIDLKVQLSEENGIIADYVRCAIEYGCSTEVFLYYTDEINGTADALRYDNVTNTLRIFDLKTGDRQASIDQCYIYAALWCLQNHVDPLTLNYDLRIFSKTYPVVADGSDVPMLVMDSYQQCMYVNEVYNEVRGGM